MTQEQHFSSDSPISNKVEDKFQRYDFAKRIAHTIINREDDNCIVIGVYGAWGEGKTSVLNFIDSELGKAENIIRIKFNPWRYSNEDNLLAQFFHKLAAALNKNLKQKSEALGELLQRYGKYIQVDIPWIGNIGEKAKEVGEALSEIDIETLKERIEEIIKENEKKIVVFIDDIDRLDKSEIHAIFRLVKLTADFKNISYILSFDEEMVSAAIGDRFGEGNRKAGQNFLEKIIQVPLTIPVAQPEALKTFCFELVDKAINSNKIELTKEEIQRFVNEFTSNIVVKLETPRLAVRYGNSLSFSLPLLVGEVNIVDLMLLEAFKIFYPKHYHFIKSYPEYFIGSYSEDSRGSKEKKQDEIKEALNRLGENLSKKQNKCVIDLLSELFPILEEVFRNLSYADTIYPKWYKEKRICSPKYFSRYFSYAVIKGEVSDSAYQVFISNIGSQERDEIVKALKDLIGQSSAESVFFKLRVSVEDFDWEITKRISKAICWMAKELSELGDTYMRIDSPAGMGASFIYHLIKQHNNQDERLKLAKETLQESTSLDFSYDLNDWFHYGKAPEERIFNDEEYVKLENILLEKAQSEAGITPLFEKFPNTAARFYNSWAVKDKEELDKYIKDLLGKNPEKTIKLLSAFTPTWTSSSNTEGFKSDFSQDRFKYFENIFDVNYIDEQLSASFSKEQIAAETIKWTRMDNTQTEVNIVRQFQHWLQQTKSEIPV